MGARRDDRHPPGRDRAPLQNVLATNPERTAVLEAAGLVRRGAGGFTVHPVLEPADPATGRSVVAARLSGLRQALDAAESEQIPGAEQRWAQQSDEVLLNQGRASAATGRAIAGRVVPALPGLPERLARAGARILDVGTGVAALAVVLATEFPAAEVVGVDVLQRALDLAKAELEQAGPEAAARIAVRLQDVGDISEQNAYDLVWLPIPFLSGPALTAALPRLHTALRPGGWLVAGTHQAFSDPLRQAVAAWTGYLNGGNSASDTDRAAEALRTAGFGDDRRFPTVPGGPILLAARKSPDPE
ncbi:SAM-dependent methyltransferase [Catenulispora yoronensis]